MDGAKRHVFCCNDLPRRSFHVFQDMRNGEEFCDITFQVGSQSISAHRIVVFAAIPYFRELLEKKSAEGNKEEGIAIHHIEPNALMRLIEFAYCCEVEINMENVIDLFSAACFLRVAEVREACCCFLADNLNPDNVLSIRSTASSLYCSELLKIIDCYVKEHFCEVSHTEEFSNCSLAYLKALVRKDDLNVENEEKVFEAVLNWVRASPEERSAELPELLPEIRMALFKPLHLTKIVESEELIRTSISCRDLIDQAKNFSLFPEKEKTIDRWSVKPRSFFKICSQDGKKDDKRIYMLETKLEYSMQQSDFTQENCLIEESKTFLLNSISSVELRNQMYIFNRGVVTRYDPESKEYKHYTESSFPRSFAGVVSFKNKIFVCGGSVSGVASNVVQCFDPEKKEWRNVTSMRVRRWSPSVVSLGEYVFVLGGRDDKTTFDYVERYDSTNGNWRIMAAMLTRRCSAGCAVLNGKIYICGGYTLTSGINCISTAEMYNPCADEWTFISPMSVAARYEFILLPYCNKLYALGGKGDKGKRLYSVEMYDPETNEWTFGPETDPYHGISAAVVMHD